MNEKTDIYNLQSIFSSPDRWPSQTGSYFFRAYFRLDLFGSLGAREPFPFDSTWFISCLLNQKIWTIGCYILPLPALKRLTYGARQHISPCFSPGTLSLVPTAGERLVAMSCAEGKEISVNLITSLADAEAKDYCTVAPSCETPAQGRPSPSRVNISGHAL